MMSSQRIITQLSDIPIRKGQKYSNWSVEDGLERGDLAEAAFINIMLHRKFTIQRASSKEDWKEHWDYKFSRDDRPDPFTVDIKARRHFLWHSDFLQDDYVCIEFLNTIGQKGWIYGQANYIAFERTHDFVVIALPDLISLMQYLFSPDAGYHKDVEYDKNNANLISKPYKFLHREGKFELFYWIETTKLFDYKHIILRKIK